MPALSNLQQAYVDGLKKFTGGSSIRKVSRQKKTDEKDEKPVSAFRLYDPSLGAKQAFPVTKNMFVLSLLFWVFMVVLIYMLISYGVMYARITQEQDLGESCDDRFQKIEELNRARVESYPIGDAGPYLIRLQPSKQQEDFPLETKTLPPIVTGVTSAEFFQVQGLIHHLVDDIKSTHSDLHLIIYDLGLYQRERELLQRYCQCEVRDFDFDNFPVHVRHVSNFAWRPIILQLLLKEFGSVMYIEPSARFKSPSSVNSLRMRGSKDYFLWDPRIFTSLIAYTDYGLFKYFNESRCAFRDSSLLSSEAIVLYRTKAAWDDLMKPWLKCVLNAECSSPPYARYKGCIEIRKPKTTGCHRYDMSALSIILNRGHQYTIDRENMVSFRLTYTAAEEATFFPEQPWTYYEILLVCCIPVFVVIAYKLLCKRRRFCR